MFSKHVRSWLLASAITVVFAVVLLTVAVPTPAEAGVSVSCYNAYVEDVVVGEVTVSSCHEDPYPRTCSQVRAACRQNEGWAGYMKRGYHEWKQICGPAIDICTP